MIESRQTLLSTVTWIGSSQVAMRLARILSTIVIARVIAPESLGVAAIALAVNELSHVFAKNATNSRIIRSDESEVKALSDTAYFINWIVGAALFLFQCLVGLGVATIYNDNALFQLIAVLGLSYLLLPFAQVHSALNLRQEKIGLISKTEIQQTVLDAAMTIGMVLLGFGLWALILPKLLVVPVWIRAHRRACSWRPPKKVTLSGYSEHVTFNSKVLGVELLGVVRHNIDYVLIGYFLGMQALGIYYFAYNAGLGLSRGFIISLNNAFYPYLCAVRNKQSEMGSRFRRGLTYMLLLMLPLLALQAYFANWYVPLLFGQHWVDRGAAEYVSILCLAGIPLLIMEGGTQFIRAQGKPLADLHWQAVYSVIFIVAILIGLQWGLIGVVLAVLFSQCFAAPIHFYFVLNLQKMKDETSEFSKLRGYMS